jgi:DNA-binding PadR family transcriptional regulator
MQRSDVALRYIAATMWRVLEIAVLGLLKEQDMHGYEVKKRLSDVFGLASAVSFGSLYPALARLEAAGAVYVVDAEGVEAAGDASLAGTERRASRRRKVYGITASGAEMFEELLASSQSGSEDERYFNLRLAFARYMPPERRLGLLEQRRAVLGERLAQLAARARARRDDRYMRILAERQQEALSRDVSWLDNLIQEERLGTAGARPAEPRAASPGVDATRGGSNAPLPRLVPLASASQLQRAARGLVSPAPAASKRPLAEVNSPDPVKDGN